MPSTKMFSLGNAIAVPFDGTIGRIEILKAKQVIAQKIRSIEYSAVYDEFKSKEGTIVHGVIHKCERHGVTVKIHDALAFCLNLCLSLVINALLGIRFVLC